MVFLIRLWTGSPGQGRPEGARQIVAEKRGGG